MSQKGLIFGRLAEIEINLKTKKAEEELDLLIEQASNLFRGSEEHYFTLPYYQKMLNYCLQENVERGIIVAKALSRERPKDPLPKIFKDKISFALGVTEIDPIPPFLLIFD